MWGILVTIQAGRDDNSFTGCSASLTVYYPSSILVDWVGVEPTQPEATDLQSAELTDAQPIQCYITVVRAPRR